LLKPKRAFLTHLSHDVNHVETSKTLPAGCSLAYDGLRLEL
jgi:phosphoribosyl 1,2-cyclic phosphate phosphodiesterase